MHSNYKRALLKPYTSQAIENGTVFMHQTLRQIKRFNRKMIAYGIDVAMGSVVNFSATPQGDAYWRRFYRNIY